MKRLKRQDIFLTLIFSVIFVFAFSSIGDAGNGPVNFPPVCDANGPYITECGDSTSLDGSGSFDPDGDPLSYEWDFGDGSPTESGPTTTTTHIYPNQAGNNYTATLTVTDDSGSSDSCDAQVSVVDITPPDITCPPTATYECDQLPLPDVTGAASATDGCDSAPTISFSDSGGSTITRTWTATDASGNASSCVQIINAVDTTPPDIQCNALATITPPDAPVSFTATATDDCTGDPNSIITSYDCFKFTKKGERIDKTESCIVEIDGETVTIMDTGGVGDHIIWTVVSTDDAGNQSEYTCGLIVVKPTR